MKKACKEISDRITNAENSFFENVVEQFGFTVAEAEKILRIYKNVKAVKLDHVMGKYNLTSGLFWDRHVMINALKTAKG